MPKTSQTPTRRTRRAASGRRSRVPARERALDVITQLSSAARHPSAAILGGLLGGVVPWFARSLAHGEIPQAWAAGNRTWALGMVAIVLGCAIFSVLTVYKFGLAAFGDPRKSVGFVAALEGVMLVSHGTTSIVALLLLIVINAIANGCVIAVARDQTLRRQADDARRSATRARNRAQASGVAPSTVPASAPQAPTRANRRPSSAVTHPVPRDRPSTSTSTAIAVRRRRRPEVIEDAEIQSYTYS